MDKKEKKKVAVLGATGAVGQRFVQLLSEHPWFELTAVAASESSRGKAYGKAARWLLPRPIPEAAARLEVLPAEPARIEADLVFSALEADAAVSIEPAFRDAGFTVVSNAKSFRMAPGVPLVVPEINGDHLEVVRSSRDRGEGVIVKNPNCTTIGLCLALDPLRSAFGLRSVLVTTMQALSGAGYPGVASLDAFDNVVPEIAGEEEKVETEPRKIFGSLQGEGFMPAEFTVSAQCNRVPVRDGHTLSVSVGLARPATLEEAREAYRSYGTPRAPLALPTAPERPVRLTAEFARPQPVLDREAGDGMTVTVGRLRECPVLDFRFAVLVHNTVRGAAGNAVLIAELMAAKGLI